MTTRRVVIGNSGGASPFIVTIAGVNADSGAQFDNLVFDGNQAPLQIHSNSYMFLAPLSQADSTNGITVKFAYGVGTPVIPPGTRALFMQMWRQPNFETGNIRYGGGNGVIVTPEFNSSNEGTGQGAGGAMDDTQFVALTFARPVFLPSSGTWTGFPSSTVINFCVFKNYQ